MNSSPFNTEFEMGYALQILVRGWVRFASIPKTVIAFLAERHLTILATLLFGPLISIVVTTCACLFGSWLLGTLDATQDIGHWILHYTGWITIAVWPTIWSLLLIAAERAGEAYHGQILESQR